MNLFCKNSWATLAAAMLVCTATAMGTPIIHVAVDTGFSTATPEPSAWMLMACGLGFCLWVGVSVAAAVSAWMLMACGLGLLAVGRRLHPRKLAHSVHSKALALAAILVFSLRPAPAQWLNHPTPGIPRTSDGKPNLAVAPRTSDGKPDLSGIWGMNGGKYLLNVAADLKPGALQPKADALFRQNADHMGRDSTSVKCLPMGPFMILDPFMMQKIIQTPSLIVILGEDLTYRQIFLDGRDLPKDPNPTFMGYSVGHWDGDTLVVETIGFNDRTWLDGSGHPHSEALRTTERFRRSDFGHMEIQETLEDPATFTKPVTITSKADLAPDTEVLEFVCAENEKDAKHMVGTFSEDMQDMQNSVKHAVKVAPEVLSKYVGTYEVHIPQNPASVMLVHLTLVHGALLAEGIPVIPLSDTLFSLGGTKLEFVPNDQGVVTHMLVDGVTVANRSSGGN